MKGHWLPIPDIYGLTATGTGVEAIISTGAAIGLHQGHTAFTHMVPGKKELMAIIGEAEGGNAINQIK